MLNFMKFLLKVLLFQIKAVPLHRNSEIQQLLNALFDVFFDLFWLISRSGAVGSSPGS